MGPAKFLLSDWPDTLGGLIGLFALGWLVYMIATHVRYIPPKDPDEKEED